MGRILKASELQRQWGREAVMGWPSLSLWRPQPVTVRVSPSSVWRSRLEAGKSLNGCGRGTLEYLPTFTINCCLRFPRRLRAVSPMWEVYGLKCDINKQKWGVSFKQKHTLCAGIFSFPTKKYGIFTFSRLVSVHLAFLLLSTGTGVRTISLASLLSRQKNRGARSVTNGNGQRG